MVYLPRTSSRRASIRQPSGCAHHVPGADVQGRAALGARRNRPRRRSPSACRWSTASRRSASGASRSTPSASRSTPEPLASRGIGVDQVTNAVNDQNVNMPTGVMWGPHQTITVQATGTALQRTQFRRSSSRTTTARRCICATWRTSRTTCRTTSTAAWYNDERSVGLVRAAPAGHQYRRGHERRPRRCSTRSKARSRRCRPCASPTIGPCRSRRGVHDVKFALRRRARARRARDLRLSPQRLGDDHPEPRAADVRHRHVLGDVPAPLQHRQPLPHGAHARRGLRRR